MLQNGGHSSIDSPLSWVRGHFTSQIENHDSFEFLPKCIKIEKEQLEEKP